MKRELSGIELIAHLAAEIKRFGTQKAFALEIGVSESYICDILNYRREPGEKVLQPLGFERKVTYLPIVPKRREKRKEK